MKKLQLTRTVPGKEEVKELYRKEKDTRLKERYHAMYLMHEFQNAGKVAELIGKTKMTLLKWVKAFNEVGIEGAPVRFAQWKALPAFARAEGPLETGYPAKSAGIRL